ncbi:MAG: hypothetical protein A2167_03675 [Planctomycetes bacterium RBG_13_46_10]|nr:MAG: hypothetical protein A2167_03675 [Planctomycetes bacterium RBG_13_46_10]
MEKPPYTFRSIMKFSVKNVEKKHPKLDNIAKLTLEFDAEIPHGSSSLVLVDPAFLPFGGPIKHLERLEQLQAQDIDHIDAFCEIVDQLNPKNARIEIWMNNGNDEITIFCKKIDGLPNRAEAIK